MTREQRIKSLFDCARDHTNRLLNNQCQTDEFNIPTFEEVASDIKSPFFPWIVMARILADSYEFGSIQ